jgi:RNA-directed DNA polymerase
MGLWSRLKWLWNWLRYGSGFGVEELARRLGWKAADLETFQPGYREVTVPKRSGGQRRLCVPEESLKALQRAILHRLLARLKVHPAATGFQRGQSIVTHARQHASRAVVIRLDLKDFFPSTRADRVRRYFRKIGWNRPAANLLTRLCTHQSGLPQGAPTSPRLSNLVNYRLDCRLAGMARKLLACYSRYADDLTLSFPSADRKKIHYWIRFVRRVVNAEGYYLHGAKKLHIRRQHQQQRVTGLVVNAGVNLPRAVRRRLRAVDHHLRTGRPATLTPEQLAGWKALQHMVAAQALEPTQAEQFRREQDSLLGAWVVVGAEHQGKPVPAGEFAQSFMGLKWIIREEGLLLEQGDLRTEAKYRLNPFLTPKALDLTPTCGPHRGKRVQGIYELQQSLLKVCLNHGEGKRPTEFTTPADSRWTLLILQRDTSGDGS